MKRRILILLLPLLLFLPPAVSDRAAGQTKQEPQIRVTTELVRVPVVAIDKHKDRLFTELKQENFTILENGVRQTITGFESDKAPLTLLLLLEDSRIIQYIRGEAIRPAGIFISQILEPQDYAAIMAFDLRPRVLADFTKNRQKLVSAVNDLARGFPAFSESNLFDAVKFALTGGTLDDFDYKGLAEIEGRTG